MRQIVLDTETTGLEWRKGNRVVEIGCVELVERRPTGRTWHQYIQSGREFEPGAQRSRADLDSSPKRPSRRSSTSSWSSSPAPNW